MLNQSKLKNSLSLQKKLVVPSRLQLRRFILFPEQKNSADTKRQRTNASIKLRDILSNILKSCEEKKSRDFKLPEQLQHITCFPKVCKMFK